jgi:hypothetical protein
VQHLTSQQPDTRAAAAAALAHAVDSHPSTTSASLAAVVALYGEDLEDQMDEARAAVLLDDTERAAREEARQQQAATRAGVAAALEALSGVLSPGPDVNTALDFLVSRGLAEPEDRVREAMVGAGERMKRVSVGVAVLYLCQMLAEQRVGRTCSSGAAR